MTDTNERSGVAMAIFFFVLASLVISAIYALLQFLPTSFGFLPEIEDEHLRGEYFLMLIQCILGIIVLFLPSVLERRLQIAIPNFMFVLFALFLYASIFLGEVRSFYYRIPHWDLILHGFSGLMLGALSFSVITLLNETSSMTSTLTPAFVAVFAFSFAVSIGVIWEIYEFGVDGLFELNMQKHSTATGSPLIGRAALRDTMYDLILNSIGALTMALVGYVSLKDHKGWIRGLLVRRVGSQETEDN
ncbi:MAG: hypothetical protein ACOC7J_06550 [Armatimonadota bacterium]